MYVQISLITLTCTYTNYILGLSNSGNKEAIPIKSEEKMVQTKLDIMDGRTALGIEFGSTRI
ncbi:hypothetical protein [Enterococcus sp. AZ163]|uniref:hypothetical protein n=1 Tax=Enterococcus sp. AZ163 TaxID=2774638 RepID=UPI003D2A7DDA